MKQMLDGISFEMGQMHDFSFLRKYGTVFQVFDDQDSGNICFGMRDINGRRRFIKYAGATTKRGTVTPQIAVQNLRKTVSIYRELAHPSLIRLLECFDTESGGFGMVFDWEDGDCMGRMYPEAHERFCALPQEHHLQVFEDVMTFLENAAEKGYLAVDFYDGSVMYDAHRRKTTICDTDFFRKSPSVNDMGRMWGSTRFMAPEEFEYGAALDEVTNVYTVGAFAFALFGCYSRELDDWKLDEDRYNIAKKAVAVQRNERPQSIREFMCLWRQATQSS